MITYVCTECKKDFSVYPSRGRPRFCSVSCKKRYTANRNSLPLTVADVRELFSYDPVSGELRWQVSNSWKVSIGDIAGTRHHKGHIEVEIKGKVYLAHRLIWLHYYGKEPPAIIDHKDRQRSNNTITNLRPATNRQNQHNSRVRRRSRFGLKGVTKYGKQFLSQIYVDGKSVRIGVFDTPAEAHNAFVAVAIKEHGEFFCDGHPIEPDQEGASRS